jgi:hypothetical protein
LGAYAQGEISGPLEIKATTTRRWPFQILERINNNAYKVDLPGEYGDSVIFNVSDLTLFDVGDDSRSNHFEERGDDADQTNTKRNHANDPLEVPIGPITRARAKKLKETLNGFVQNIWSKMDLERLKDSL